jgi:hypothetical protein
MRYTVKYRTGVGVGESDCEGKDGLFPNKETDALQ